MNSLTPLVQEILAPRKVSTTVWLASRFKIISLHLEPVKRLVNWESSREARELR